MVALRHRADDQLKALLGTSEGIDAGRLLHATVGLGSFTARSLASSPSTPLSDRGLFYMHTHEHVTKKRTLTHKCRAPYYSLNNLQGVNWNPPESRLYLHSFPHYQWRCLWGRERRRWWRKERTPKNTSCADSVVHRSDWNQLCSHVLMHRQVFWLFQRSAAQLPNVQYLTGELTWRPLSSPFKNHLRWLVFPARTESRRISPQFPFKI